MNFLRLVLLLTLTLLALSLMGRAHAGPPCGPGGGNMGGPPPGMSGPPPGMSGPPPGMSGPPPGMSGPPPGMSGPGGGWGGGSQGSVTFGACGPPAGGEAASTRQVINILDNYLKKQPNLKAGNLQVKGGYWEAEILDSQGNLVNKLRIDPRNGFFYYQK